MKVKEFAQVINGATPSTSNPENYGGDIAWITPKDLSDQKSKYISSGERSITKKGYNSCSTTLLPSGNILLSSRAPIGLLAITANECCTNQGFKNLLIDKKKVDVEYLYYYLKHHIKEIEALGVGTTFKEVSKTAIENFDIEIPALEKQKQISNILASIDEKIALNRSINQTLEVMAKHLYDYWFVQFDFPNAEGKPYKSSGGKMIYNETLKREIPEGWEVGNLLDLSNLITGGTPSKAVDEYWLNGDIPFFGPTDCDGSMYQFTTEYRITEDGVKHSAAKVMNENCIIITARGSIGKYVITGIPMAMNQSCFAFESNEGCYEHLYFLVGQLIQHLLVKGSGSTFKSIVGIDIENSILSLGESSIRKKFADTTNPIFAKIKANTQETLHLQSLRDYLLPLLMNGQVTIKN